MDQTLFATTPLLGLTPLGSAGDRSYPQLTEILSRRLGLEYALLLAEPVPHPDGTTVDWYVPGQRRAVPLQALQGAMKDYVLTQLEHLQAGVMQLADAEEKLGKSGQILAQSLRNAMTVPGPDRIYAMPVEVDGQTVYRPVLVNWAHRMAGALTPGGGLEAETLRSRPIGGLQGQVPAPLKQPVPEELPRPAAVVAERLPFRWHLLLLWLLFALLTSLLLWRLLPACGVIGARFLGFEGLSFCRKPASVQLAALDDLPQLNAMIGDLELELARRHNDCQMADMRRQADLAARPPEPPPKSETEKRIEDANKTLDKLSFALTWQGYADLDLEVKCPTGAVLNYRNKGQLICNGKFEEDMNNDKPENATGRPIEYVNWKEDPPKGTYNIAVEYFSKRTERSDSVPYKVEVYENGKVVRTFTGTLTKSGASNPVQTFQYTR